jgi:uncharacterized oxidoreductase
VKLSQNTILITGGTSGIGYNLAAQLLALGNSVIVTGRDPTKLDLTKKKLPQVNTYQSDVSDPEAIKNLFQTIQSQFPSLNILINNAGVMKKLNLHQKNHDLVDLTKEIEINLMGPIRMTQTFLPHLKLQPQAAIVNVSSGLAFLPLPIAPIYSATKAALHSYTLSLRAQLKNTSVKVFELAPPGTDTPLFVNETFTKEDSGGIKPMNVATLAAHAIQGLAKDQLEICPGIANNLKWMSRAAPQLGMHFMSKSAEKLPTF